MVNNFSSLDATELEYLADLLRALLYFKDDISGVSIKSLKRLEITLAESECALRAAVGEMRSLRSCHSTSDIANA